jgi:hypothetical protein
MLVHAIRSFSIYLTIPTLQAYLTSGYLIPRLVCKAQVEALKWVQLVELVRWDNVDSDTVFQMD